MSQAFALSFFRINYKKQLVNFWLVHLNRLVELSTYIVQSGIYGKQCNVLSPNLLSNRLCSQLIFYTCCRMEHRRCELRLKLSGRKMEIALTKSWLSELQKTSFHWGLHPQSSENLKVKGKFTDLPLTPLIEPSRYSVLLVHSCGTLSWN